MIRSFILAALAVICLGQGAMAQTSTILRKPDNTAAYQAMDQATGAAIQAGVGAIGDTAYAGSGNASLIAAEKGSYGRMEAVRAILAAGITVNLGTIGGAATDSKLEQLRVLLAAQPAGTSAAPVYQVPAALPASGFTPVTVTLATNTISTAVTPVPGRTLNIPIAGTGSAPVLIVYSRDGGTNWTRNVAGVDFSAPIRTEATTYAGVPGTMQTTVTEANSPAVKVAICPGDLTSATTCVGTVTGTVTASFYQ